MKPALKELFSGNDRIHSILRRGILLKVGMMGLKNSSEVFSSKLLVTFTGTGK